MLCKYHYTIILIYLCMFDNRLITVCGTVSLTSNHRVAFMEIVYIYHILCFDNDYYFHRFMDSLLKKIEACHGDISYKSIGSESIIESFYNTCYDISGELDRQLSTPSIRMHPICLYTTLETLRGLTDIYKASVGTSSIESRYRNVFSQLRKLFPSYITDNQLQDMTFNSASLNLYLPFDFTLCYKPNEQVLFPNRLNKSPFQLLKREYIPAVIRCLKLKLPHLLPIQVHGILSIVTQDNFLVKISNMQQHMYESHVPYRAIVDFRNHVKIQKCVISTENDRQPKLLFQTVDPPQYALDDDILSTLHPPHSSQYTPSWTRNKHHMNLGVVSFPCSWKISSEGRLPAKECDETILELGMKLVQKPFRPDIKISYHFQLMLDSAAFAALQDLPALICTWLDCDLNALHHSICHKRFPSSSSRPPPVIANLRFDSLIRRGPFLVEEINMTQAVALKRCNQIGIVPSTNAYKNKYWAELALYLHVLFHVKVFGKKHWICCYLNDTRQGFLILIPEASHSTRTCYISCFIFRDIDHPSKILCSFIDTNGIAQEPFLLIDLQTDSDSEYDNE